MRVLLFLLLAGLGAGLAPGQDAPDARTAYLRATGQEAEAAALEAWLLDELATAEPALPVLNRKQMAAFFAFVMTLSGVTAEKAERLQAEGVDVLHAITADMRPLSEQVLLSDLVIVGDVVELAETPAPGDGQRTSIGVVVREVVKGTAPGDTVVVRQQSRLGESGSRDLQPEIGERYLLLLSNGMYRFFVASRGADEAVPEADLARHFSTYRWYRMEDDRLLWNGYDRRDTERALREVRRVDHLLGAR